MGQYNSLSLLFYFLIFQQNLLSVQKCPQIKEKYKNHCDLSLWSIWTNFIPKYAQIFQVFEKKKKNKNNLFRHFSLRGVFHSEDPNELLLVRLFFNINYMNFYATFFIRSKSKEYFKKKRIL